MAHSAGRRASAYCRRPAARATPTLTACWRLLQEACREGDADAYCLLARCLYGQEYTWLGHDFPVDEGAADELVYQSVMMGSALGTLIAMRCGVINKELAEAMPLASLKAAYDIILEKAEAGDAFCQMVIGNVYYWYEMPFARWLLATFITGTIF